MARRISQKKQKSYLDAVRVFLQEIGARPSELARYIEDSYALDTKAGLLAIHVFPTVSELGVNVCCRFEDVARACALFGVSAGSVYNHAHLNVCSGKWNHHYFSNPVEDVVRDLRSRFAKIL